MEQTKTEVKKERGLTERLTQLRERFKFGNWVVNEKGVHKQKTIQVGDTLQTELETVIGTPVIPSRGIYDEDTGTLRREVIFWQGRWRTVALPDSYLTNSSLIVGKLTDLGIRVDSNNAKAAVKYFSDFIQKNSENLETLMGKSSLGWVKVDDELLFMPYTDKFFFSATENQHLYRMVSEAGSLEKWVQLTRQYRTKLPVRLVMAASFASPLLYLLGANPFICHVWGLSGYGKTLAVIIAMSVWGQPEQGKLTQSLDSTDNNLMLTASFFNHIPIGADELQTVRQSKNELNYDKTIMKVTNAQDRGKNKNGTTAEVRKTWQNVFITSGEEDIVKSSSNTGAKNRVISIGLAEKLFPIGNTVKQDLMKNHGTAGRKYIEYVKENLDFVQTAYQIALVKIMKTVNTTDKQASAMAAMLTADTLANRLFYAESGEYCLDVESVRDYLLPEESASAPERAYQFVCSYVAIHNDNFVGAGRDFWGSFSRDSDNEINIVKEVLEKALADNGFSLEACYPEWEKRGYVVRNTADKNRKYFQVRNGQARCWAVRLRLEKDKQ